MSLERLHRTYHLSTDGDASDTRRETWDALDMPSVSLDELELTRTARRIGGGDRRLDASNTYDGEDGGGWHDMWSGRQAADLFRYGFEWDESDGAVTDWFPQGITGTGDAYDDGELDGRRYLAVSWYQKDASDEVIASRITFIDVTERDSRLSYRHALLVEPVVTDGHRTFRVVESHAGGLVWFKRYLYVASTSRLLVFDLQRMRSIPGDQDDLGRDAEYGRIGHVPGRFAALGYRYVIPLVRTYEFEGTEALGKPFDTLSLDRDSDPPRLVSAKFVVPEGSTIYEDDLDRASVLFLRLGDDGAIEDWDTGRVGTDEAWRSHLRYVQGVFAQGDDIWFCQSSGTAKAALVRRSKTGGSGEGFDWATWGESLHYDPWTGELWNLTEWYDERIVFCVRLSDVT